MNIIVSFEGEFDVSVVLQM